MATRILGPTGSKRRKRFLLGPLLLVAALTALFLAGSAQAVHDLGFQLDGEVSTHAYTVPPSPPGAPAIYDWGANTAGDTATQASPNTNGLFTVSGLSGATQTVSNNSDLIGSGKPFAAASFQRDFESGSPSTNCSLSNTSTTFCTADDSTYATGSKDTLGIGNGGWQCNHDNNVNSKIDIMNAYTASYYTGANNTGHHIIYFGLEKNKNNGTNDVGIWLLQGNASCSAPSGHVNFTGQHRNKDVLVVSEFSQGGGVSSIKAYQWAAAASGPLSGDGGCIDSLDNPNPKAGGCNGLPIATSNSDCKTAGGGDSLCATTNANCTDTTLACGKPWNNTVFTPWLTSDATLGVGHRVVSPDFFEGGIDITQVFGNAGGQTAPSCFNTVVPDTRSSTSTTATLFDFVTNKLGECSSSLTTNENAASSRQIATNGTISSGTDNATLKITGTSVWNGTMSWYLCGPNVTTCDTGGYLVTDSMAVHSTDTANADGTYTYTSGSTTLTSAGVDAAGEYCWHAKFTPDTDTANAGVGAAEDNGANECFFVTPVTPTLSTSASCSADPCVIGSTLNDTATLSGTARNPDPANPGSNSTYPTINGGTVAADSSITWQLFGPGTAGAAQCTTAISSAPTPASRTVSGDNDYLTSYVTSSSDKVGKYEFAASYPGDGTNTLAATDVGCDTTGTNGEQVTVIGSATSSSAQRWLPNDRVVLGSTAGTTLHGTLTVTLYKGTFTGTRDNCGTGTATAVSGQSYGTANNVSTSTNSFVLNTSNTTFVIGTNSDGTTTGAGTDGDYFWFIHYVDDSLTSPNDRCETATISHNDG